MREGVVRPHQVVKDLLSWSTSMAISGSMQ